MDFELARDYISDLPESSIENILTRIPIREAVKTSILSSKWRYRWANLTELRFDDQCMSLCLSDNREFLESRTIKFITQVLFLHQGPVHKFHISIQYIRSCPTIDQWILFLSRNDLKELILELGEDEWYRIPSCIFSCQKLTRLELFGCQLDPPLTFKGFSSMRNLRLNQVLDDSDVIERVISSCPLLETLMLSSFDNLALCIRAPNLKYLTLEGEFKDICLENTPRLICLSVEMYMTDDIAEQFEQNLGCNFIKLLGGVPHLERLIGQVYFTKYLSIGNDPERVGLTFNHLDKIKLLQVNFEDVNEIQVVLQLIMDSPSLQELHISMHGCTDTLCLVAPDFELWDIEHSSGYILKHLRTVKVYDISGFQHEMNFIRFLLENSPALETLSIRPCPFIVHEKLNLVVELLKFRRSSAKAEILFIQD